MIVLISSDIELLSKLLANLAVCTSIADGLVSDLTGDPTATPAGTMPRNLAVCTAIVDGLVHQLTDSTNTAIPSMSSESTVSKSIETHDSPTHHVDSLKEPRLRRGWYARDCAEARAEIGRDRR